MVEVSPRLVKIAKTAMLLNGDGHSGMTKGNSLGPYEKMDDWIKARCGRHQPTLVLTNPPFAGTAEGQITDAETLAQYEVAHRWTIGATGFQFNPNELVEGCPPEMLFFERCLDWLAPGGSLGIVMPKSFLDTATYRPARELLFRSAQLLGVINCHKNTFQPHTGVRTCVVLIRKRRVEENPSKNYEIFFAVSRKIGRDSEGRPIFKIDSDGKTTTEIDHDLDEILKAFSDIKKGTLVSSGYSFSVESRDLDESLNINPQKYLPHLNESLREIQRLDGCKGWTVTSLAQIEQGVKIYKGPRLKTENLLVETHEDGLEVEPYYTPSAVLQDKRDSIKWLDLSKASSKQHRDFNAVRVVEGDLLITRSGTIGRVAYITKRLNKAIVSDDAIRVRITSKKLRAYVYGYLQSCHAQNQLLMNEYGAVQQHLEPSHVADLLVPVPDDWNTVEPIVAAALEFFASKEQAENSNEIMSRAAAEIFGSAVAPSHEPEAGTFT